MLKKQGTDLFRAGKADVGRGMKFSSECAVPWAQLTIFGAICGTCTALEHWVNPQYSQRWRPGRADPHSTKFEEAKFFHYDISFWVLIRAQNPNWGLSGTPNMGTRPLLSLTSLIWSYVIKLVTGHLTHYVFYHVINYETWHTLDGQEVRWSTNGRPWERSTINEDMWHR